MRKEDWKNEGISAAYSCIATWSSSHSHWSSPVELCKRDENEIKGSISQFLLKQAIKECFKEAIKHAVCRRQVRLSKTNNYKLFASIIQLSFLIECY